MIHHTHVNMKKLASALVFLVFQSCKVVKQLGNSDNLQKFSKCKDDPVTQADFKIQTLIVKGIKQMYPTLAIVGEESADFEGQIDVNFNNMENQILPSHFQISDNVPIQELCVWIDPIDNTKGFIKKKFDEVTILVGISRNAKANFGIVGLPYAKQNVNEAPIYDPQVLIGSVEAKKAFSSKKLGEWTMMESKKIHQPIIVDVSDTRDHPDNDKFIKEINAVKMSIGGSGKKNVRVIKGEADFMLYYKAVNSKWDTCAGESILKALGGFFYSVYGDELLYDHTAHETKYKNTDGNICSYDEQLIKRWLQFVKENESLI